MVQRSKVRRRVHVPRISTAKAQTNDYQFSAGLDENSSNDDVNPNNWRYITDAREVQVGKWETRHGADYLSTPIGEAVNVEQAATTGADDFGFGSTTRFAQKLTATADGRLSAIQLNVRNPDNATGTVLLTLYSDRDGVPGTLLITTSIAASAITADYQYLMARSISCPDISAGTSYWLVGYVQEGRGGAYQVSTTTAGATGRASFDGGITWLDQSFDYNVKLYTATSKPTKGCIRLTRPNGTKHTFFAQSDTLYEVDEATGNTTAVDSQLDANASFLRFGYVNDELYYVQGSTTPRKYDFSEASSVDTATGTAADVIVHKGLLFFTDGADPNKVFYSNFGEYDKYTSTDFFYVPAPKTGDPNKGLAILNGNMYILTRNSKYVLYGAENATFRLDSAIGRKGTFSRQSFAYDKDSIFLASDDGIYRFNGAEERNIAAPVLNWWSGLLNKENVVLELHNNRLYIFYTPNDEAQNARCKVYNVLYGIWESEDIGTYVANAHTEYDTDNIFLQGSNRVGMVMIGESPTNDYNNLGEPLTWELRTAYNHYGTPAQYKRAPYFRPHFDTVSGNYRVETGYALDYSQSPVINHLALGGDGSRFNTGIKFGSGATFGGRQQVNPTDNAMVIAGHWRRLQLRYKHEAAREPVSFDGHVLTLETQRLV